MADAINTGINVGEAQVVQSVIPQVKQATPFATIAAKQKEAAETEKKKKDALTQSAMSRKLTPMTGVYENDIPFIKNITGQFYSELQKSLADGSYESRRFEFDNMENGIASAIELSKRKKETVYKIDAERAKYKGDDTHEEVNTEFYDAIRKPYDPNQFNLQTLFGDGTNDGWAETNQKLLENTSKYGIVKAFDENKMLSALNRNASAIKANNQSQTFEYTNPATGEITTTLKSDYNPEKLVSGMYDGSLSAQRRMLREVMTDDNKKNYHITNKSTEADIAKAAKQLFMDKYIPSAEVNIDKSSVKLPNNSNLTIDYSGGSGMLDKDIVINYQAPQNVLPQAYYEQKLTEYNAANPGFEKKSVAELFENPDFQSIRGKHVMYFNYKDPSDNKVIKMKVDGKEKDVQPVALVEGKDGKKMALVYETKKTQYGTKIKQHLVPYTKQIDNNYKGKNLGNELDKFKKATSKKATASVEIPRGEDGKVDVAQLDTETIYINPKGAEFKWDGDSFVYA